MDRTSQRPSTQRPEFTQDRLFISPLSVWVLTIILAQPTGTLGDECCCHCQLTLTLTRSWRNMSPPKTCRLSETQSSLSRLRYSVFFLYMLYNVGVFTKGHTVILLWDCWGFFRVLVRCPKTPSQPGVDALSQAVVQSGPHLSPESHSTRPTGGC